MKLPVLRLALSCLAGTLVSLTARADHPAIAFGSESSGPVNTIATDLLPRGAWGAGIRTEFIEFDRFSDTELENFAAGGADGVHSVDSLTNTSLSLAYGVTNDFTLSARIGYTDRQNIREGELEMGVPEAHNHGDSDGVSDLVLLGQYRIHNNDDLQVSLLGGIKAPTGETDATDAGGGVHEIEFQPGSGSWDVLLGASASKQLGRAGLHGNILYSLTTEGDRNTEIGDAFFYNLGIAWPLLDAERHADHGHDHSHLRWDAVLELNGESRRRTRVGGVSEEHSGGDLLYLAPGLRLTSGNDFSVFLSVGIPVIEDLNGIQTDTDYRIVAGVGFAL